MHLPGMFEFFFKYPIPVFTKGKFILLGAWPGWLLALLIVVSAAWAGVADLAAASGGRAADTELAGVADLGAGGGDGGPAAAAAVGAGDYRGGAEVAAEHYCGAGGRLAQHGIADAGADGTTTRETAAVQALSEVLPGLEKKFQTRMYRLDAADAWTAGVGEAGAADVQRGRARRRTSMQVCGSWWRRPAICRWARWCC